MTKMNISEEGLALLKKFEGCELKAYQEKLKTAFKVGGKISGLQNYNKVKAKEGQKD